MKTISIKDLDLIAELVGFVEQSSSQAAFHASARDPRHQPYWDNQTQRAYEYAVQAATDGAVLLNLLESHGLELAVS